jgi:hypothetical protein
LELLDLSGNNIGNEGSKSLALVSGNEGAKSLALFLTNMPGLEQLYALKEFNLGNNNIGEEGENAMAPSLVLETSPELLQEQIEGLQVRQGTA